MNNWTLPLVSAVALGAVLWSMHGGGDLLPRAGRPRVLRRDEPETFEVAMPPPPPPPSKPRAGTHPDTPVDAVFRSVVDADIPVPRATMFTGDAMPHTEDEIKAVLANVLERVNDASTLDLRLVAVDNVRKTVDAYKTLYYTITAAVYSPPGNVGIKIQAGVVVPPSSVMYLHDLRTFNAQFPTDAVRASEGPATENHLATWTPVL